MQYEEVGADSGRRFMSADERGSIIARTRSDGSLFALNAYDEYGKPESSNSGRFGYTGQAWIGQLGLNYYKARMYAPHLGLFAQTDPLGMRGGANFYAYVGGDPVNRTDPLGMQDEEEEPIYVTGKKLSEPDPFGSGFAGGGEVFGGTSGGGYSGPPEPAGAIIITAPRLPAEECSEAQSIGGCGDIVVNSNPVPPPEQPRIVPLPAAPATQPPFVRVAAPAGPDYCTMSPDNPLGVDISDACRKHDDCYGARSGKFQCDITLFNDIFDACRREFGFNSAQVCGILATSYLVGVSTGGIPFYFLTPRTK